MLSIWTLSSNVRYQLFWMWVLNWAQAMREVSTCSWKPSYYVGLLQWLADLLTTEGPAVERAQEGSGAGAQIVCCLVVGHRAIWQHCHVQLSVLKTIKNLDERKKQSVQHNITLTVVIYQPEEDLPFDDCSSTISNHAFRHWGAKRLFIANSSFSFMCV